MSGANFRPIVRAAREKLQAGRDKLRSLHDAGAPGFQVSSYLTDLVDGIVLDFYQNALEELAEPDLVSRVALVPNGGYGRRDVAPFSDVDLMLLYAPDGESEAQRLAQRLNQNIYDVGLDLGFSMRTPIDACSLALSDATIFTSVAESRFLAGSIQLFRRFVARLRRDAQRHSRSLIAAIEVSRREERAKWGETVYLLTPNIKRSVGGLRDIQLIRWVGFARYGESDPELLMRLDVLSVDDQRRLRKAHEFLLRLRNEMHFHAGKARDILDRDEQMRLADQYEHQDERLLPVERFMREYFHHTSTVQYTTAHFLATAKTRGGVRRFLNAMVSHNVEKDFWVGPVHIGATRRGREKVTRDLAEVLRLMDLANLYSKWIDHRTWEAIRHAMSRPAKVELSDRVVERFLSLLSQPARLGDLLRRLHELRVLEKIIPGMSHARCLLQFNDYHKYTVDEHSIRAVEEATRFASDSGPLGEAYRTLKSKKMLHLALLIHDLGKGHVEDHSEVGARLAEQTARRLKLSDGEAEILRYLVHKHLMMSDLAQFRDIYDPNVVMDLAMQVESPEVLQMLYVLTCADMAAVGPDVLNAWKLELLTTLYLAARRHLTGDSSAGKSEHEHEQRRRDLTELAAGRTPQTWWLDQIKALPPAYLFQAGPQQIVQELDQLSGMDRNGAVAWGRYLSDRDAVEYTVGTYEDITDGIFHRMTGVLSSQRMEILSAEINTLADGLVVDRFYVRDSDHDGAPPAERMSEVADRLTKALLKPTDRPPKFSARWGANTPARTNDAHRPPPRVRIDNSTSESCTILDIFALDRMGLLYTITHVLYELGLSVSLAKIGSYFDQVVDVFYVTDAAGQKITDEAKLAQIRGRLLDEIKRFEFDQSE